MAKLARDCSVCTTTLSFRDHNPSNAYKLCAPTELNNPNFPSHSALTAVHTVGLYHVTCRPCSYEGGATKATWVGQ